MARARTKTNTHGSTETPELSLSPSQAEAVDGLLAARSFGRVLVVWGPAGVGKTTMLRRLQQAHFREAPILSTAHFLRAMHDRHPMALEEAYAEHLGEAIAKHEAVLVDDLHLLSDIFCNHFYPRSGYFGGPMTAVLEQAEEKGRTLVFTHRGGAPDPIARRCYYFGFKSLSASDYAHLFGAYLTRTKPTIDTNKLHRFAPKLNGHQIRSACLELDQRSHVDTEAVVDYLRARRMASNVDLSEVQPVDLKSLKGLDDVLESLEAHVVLPLENDALASELQLKPKRGVLIIGPPGTGKTSVGRALAHRLKSKFFLIDGTFISGTRNFYSQIQRVIEAAKRNAPSIVFIDDSDVIFQGARDQGLYRYLLTLLDGVESEGIGQVSVMMTAMDLAHLPPALIRSGRIDLWLETRLPDEAARREILSELLANLPQAIAMPDIGEIARAAHGLTGADIKALVEDGKILYAHDVARGRPLLTSTEYMVRAVESVRANRAKYTAAAERAPASSAGAFEQYMTAAMSGAFGDGDDEDDGPS